MPAVRPTTKDLCRPLASASAYPRDVPQAQGHDQHPPPPPPHWPFVPPLGEGPPPDTSYLVHGKVNVTRRVTGIKLLTILVPIGSVLGVCRRHNSAGLS